MNTDDCSRDSGLCTDDSRDSSGFRSRKLSGSYSYRSSTSSNVLSRRMSSSSSCSISSLDISKALAITSFPFVDMNIGTHNTFGDAEWSLDPCGSTDKSMLNASPMNVSMSSAYSESSFEQYCIDEADTKVNFNISSNSIKSQIGVFTARATTFQNINISGDSGETPKGRVKRTRRLDQVSNKSTHFSLNYQIDGPNDVPQPMEGVQEGNCAAIVKQNFEFDSDINELVGKNQKFSLNILENSEKISSTYGSINGDTLSDLMNSLGVSFFDKYIIVDCRYPYEYVGGHIVGANNMFIVNDAMERFFPKDKEQARLISNKIPIFYCEFSQQRGPAMANALRSEDRKRHLYKSLVYKEIYVLDKGYKTFYEQRVFSEFCDPSHYIPMLHTGYTDEYQKYHLIHKTKLGRKAVPTFQRGERTSGSKRTLIFGGKQSKQLHKSPKVLEDEEGKVPRKKCKQLLELYNKEDFEEEENGENHDPKC